MIPKSIQIQSFLISKQLSSKSKPFKNIHTNNRFRTLIKQKVYSSQQYQNQNQLKKYRPLNSVNTINHPQSNQPLNQFTQLNQKIKYLQYRKNVFKNLKDKSLQRYQTKNLSSYENINLKQKVKSLDKGRVGSIRLNQESYKKGRQVFTHADEYEKQKNKNNKIVQISEIINRFVKKFKSIIERPIDIDEQQEKQRKYMRKMKQSSCKLLIFLMKGKLKIWFNELKKTKIIE